MSFFDVSFGDLFPRYVCQLEKPELTNTQLNYLTLSNQINPEEYLYKKELWKYVYDILKSNQKIKPAKKQYLILRLSAMGFNLTEIGRKLKVTREYIRQIQNKAIRILNYSEYKNQLI